MYLVSIRHYTNKIIPKTIINKYNNIKDNVIGINEYLTYLSITKQFNEKEYKYIINFLAQKMFKY
jgi:hypothetical protein